MCSYNQKEFPPFKGVLKDFYASICLVKQVLLFMEWDLSSLAVKPWKAYGNSSFFTFLFLDQLFLVLIPQLFLDFFLLC